jgi:hypothetical protein
MEHGCDSTENAIGEQQSNSGTKIKTVAIRIYLVLEEQLNSEVNPGGHTLEGYSR